MWSISRQPVGPSNDKALFPHSELLAEMTAYAARAHLGELGEHNYRM